MENGRRRVARRESIPGESTPDPPLTIFPVRVPPSAVREITPTAMREQQRWRRRLTKCLALSPPAWEYVGKDRREERPLSLGDFEVRHLQPLQLLERRKMPEAVVRDRSPKDSELSKLGYAARFFKPSSVISVCVRSRTSSFCKLRIFFRPSPEYLGFCAADRAHIHSHATQTAKERDAVQSVVI